MVMTLFWSIIHLAASSGAVQSKASQEKIIRCYPSPNSGSVVGMISVSGFMPPSDTSLRDLYPPSVEPFHHPDPSGSGWEIIDNGDLRELLFNDLPEDEAEYWLKQQAPQSSATLDCREGVYAGWKDVPVWVLLSTEDVAMPLAIAEEMVRQARSDGADINTSKIRSGHCPFLSQPEAFVSFVVEAVDGLMKKQRDGGQI
jgi:pimeloyl-ACP methyl ester carboxylesterase